VLRTPLRLSPWLSRAASGDVFLKLETLQPTHSYKIRGATNAVLKLAASSGSNPPRIVTASAGNHGRAMAHASAAAGMHLTVYAPENAPKTKLEAIREAGAELRLCADYDEAERRAKEHGARGIGVFISPYAHPDVIAGAGTVGLEILEDCPDVEIVLASIGGGGLISGLAIAATDHRRNTSHRGNTEQTQGRVEGHRGNAGHRGNTEETQHRAEGHRDNTEETQGIEVAGVEVEASTPFSSSLRAGRIVQIEVGETLADGLSGNLDPDSPTFEIVRGRVGRIAVVSEPELVQAIRGVGYHEKLIVEGAAAAAVAAVLSGKLDVHGKKVAVVLSGANIDLEQYGVLLGAEGC
jgi:threonine dehydratase